MGVFNWHIRLESMDGKNSLEIEAMVDTGAGYTIVPTYLLKDLGVQPIDKLGLALADGRRVEVRHRARNGYHRWAHGGNAGSLRRG